MLLLTQGEAGVECSDPFVDALKKRSTVSKYGPEVVISDLLVASLQDGTSLSYYSYVFIAGCLSRHGILG